MSDTLNRGNVPQEQRGSQQNGPDVVWHTHAYMLIYFILQVITMLSVTAYNSVKACHVFAKPCCRLY